MKYIVAALLLLSAPSAFAVSPFSICQSRLLRITSAALEAELPRQNWDVGQISVMSFNYGLPGRDRTVLQCRRESDPDAFCLVQVYTRFTRLDPQGCPDYQIAEVTSNCEPRRRIR